MIQSYGDNYFGYPTDCPHREKNGWTGDGHLAGELAMFNFGNCASYAKWMNDFADEQQDDGLVACIIPTSGWGYHWGNGPAWDSAYILIPLYMYAYYGDLRIFETHYERMKRYVEHLINQKAKNHIIYWGLGDWVPYKTTTPVALTSTAYYYVDVFTLAKMANLLGKKEDAVRYAELAKEIKKAFNLKFYDEEKGIYANGSQTALSCALYHELVEPDNVSKVVENLVANIELNDNHIDTGVLGARYILHALTDNGRVDVAYKLASQKSYPSWGHWIEQGATTLWEDWGGEASLDHIFFGDISAWFYKALAGINPDPRQPGFKHIFIKPHIVGDLTEVRATVNSIRGEIVSNWEVDEDKIKFEVKIPVNSTATIYLPAKDRRRVTEDGDPLQEAEGVKYVGKQEGRVVVKVGAGEYEFEIE